MTVSSRSRKKKKTLFRPANRLQEAMGRIAVCADAAHSFGAEWYGKKTGSIADFSSFSFHAVKNLTTAEGGALTWNPIPGIGDEDIYHQLQLYSLHGQSKDALAKTQLGAWEYDIAGPWYKCNMTDIMAAIGLAQLRRYEGLLMRRKEIIRQYDQVLRPVGVGTLGALHQRLYIVRSSVSDLDPGDQPGAEAGDHCKDGGGRCRLQCPLQTASDDDCI